MSFARFHGGGRLSIGRTEPPMRILFISASPKWEAQLELGDELRTLLGSLKGQDVDLMLLPAAQPDDLRIAVGSKRVDVVHFSGHAEDDGILLRDADGFAKKVDPEELRDLLTDQGIKMVVLNACETESIAKRLEDVVGSVVGTTKVLDDRAARQMTKVFYSTLRLGRTVSEAFNAAVTSIEKEKLPNVYMSGGSTTQQPIFPVRNEADGDVRIEGQAPFDNYYYVSYLDAQIQNLIGRIRLNRFLFALMLIGGVFVGVMLWINTPANLLRISKFGWNPDNWATIFGAPILDSLKAMGAGIPAFLSLLQGRLLIHGNAQLQSMKRLKELTKASDDMTPELREKLEKILYQSVSGADAEYASRITSVNWYRVYTWLDKIDEKMKALFKK